MSVEIDFAAQEAVRRTMVDCQVRPSDVTDPALVDAMLWAPREAFAPKSKRAQAYMGEHLEIAPGRFELDPRTFAKLADLAEPGPEDLALVVGAGMGYAAAVLSRLVAAVIALEEDPALVASMRATLEALEVPNVIVVEGPLAEGCAAHAPYNLVFVNGGSATSAPDGLVSQLADGGRLTQVRMRDAVGRGEICRKSGGALGARSAFDAAAPILPGFEAVREFEF
ncbi:MAG: protein-L-isoaspartate O-methyltransferase [Pseudomonadota bacterium]